ncbi:tubulointerstitial nephritis antigen [Plakobranchus ocellatus]|uniref:Tubulointerstitial nephritis antigen n=1 Tax=Plakobranchus ocellatus TaxID=259542 RepID=A0AAV4DB52_9GAST|nr:tubulointerstitial nephritis antigen [Plakobranchus ocellatus]
MFRGTFARTKTHTRKPSSDSQSDMFRGTYARTKTHRRKPSSDSQSDMFRGTYARTKTHTRKPRRRKKNEETKPFNTRRRKQIANFAYLWLKLDVIDHIERIAKVTQDIRWWAGNFSDLWGMTLDEGTRYRLGTFRLNRKAVDMTPLGLEDVTLPLRFDAREKWPGLLLPIQDQGNCGSSWAHSSIAVASDRFAIESKGLVKAKLSAQHLISCHQDGQLGCEGGHVDRAWWFMRHVGVVTDECYPYSSGYLTFAGPCRIAINETDRSNVCPSGTVYKADQSFHVTPAYRMRADVSISVM